MSNYTIMIIDDESQMRALVRSFLQLEKYEIIEATDGAHALSLLQHHSPNLFIVDVMMPFMDGFEFAKNVQNISAAPIIFLSAKGDEWDKIRGLKIGGDDYIVKPFHPEELLARVESVLRRTYQAKQRTETLQAGPLQLDDESHSAMIDGELLSLTLKEYGLLKLFIQNIGRVFPREQLLELIWGENHRSTERTVDTHIKTLRLKLGSYSEFIETVWGIGYRFEVHHEAEKSNIK